MEQWDLDIDGVRPSLEDVAELTSLPLLGEAHAIAVTLSGEN